MLVHRLWLGGSVWLMTSLSDQYAISLSGKLDHAMIYRYQCYLKKKYLRKKKNPMLDTQGQDQAVWGISEKLLPCKLAIELHGLSSSLIPWFLSLKRLTSRILARDDLWLLSDSSFIFHFFCLHQLNYYHSPIHLSVLPPGMSCSTIFLTLPGHPYWSCLIIAVLNFDG